MVVCPPSGQKTKTKDQRKDEMRLGAAWKERKLDCRCLGLGLGLIMFFWLLASGWGARLGRSGRCSGLLALLVNDL